MRPGTFLDELFETNSMQPELFLYLVGKGLINGGPYGCPRGVPDWSRRVSMMGVCARHMGAPTGLVANWDSGAWRTGVLSQGRSH